MQKIISLLWVILFSTNLSSKLTAQVEELGKVKWSRNLEKSQSESKGSGKPILILFQEIPGCSTCKAYGKQVLSHPLVVEAIETFFVPLVIHNNKSGQDKEVLDYFKEPAWNNPVVRIVDANLSEIGDRLSGNYSTYGLVSKIVACLMRKNIPVPEYLHLLEEEFFAQATGIQKAYIGMYCFWSGEKCYAKADGVVATKAGYMNGSEVVEVSYNPKITTLKALLDHGKSLNCADKLFNNNVGLDQQSKVPQISKGNFSVDKELKYYLYNSNYKFLPLTELQSSRMNLAIAEHQSPEKFLSVRQLDLYRKIQNQSFKTYGNMIGVPIEEAWKKFMQ